MDELNKALNIAVSGIEKDNALKAFKKQLVTWQINMPTVEPLVLDFGLKDFSNVGLIEYWVANEVKEGYCCKFLFVFEGQTCPMHHHKDKHETFYILKGQVQMTYDSRVFMMNPGDVLPVEQTKPHSFIGVKGPALLVEVSKPCIVDDNYFADKRIPIGGNYKG
jgi:mannose-6-phosphate isomerase-like protein (cupin superfamily)